MRLKTIFVVAMMMTGCGFFPLFAFATGPDSDAVIFGKGAHAFFAGKYQDAYTQLNQAVEAKTVDPRVYFFRGLAALRLNRSDAAKADFQKAARLEVSETNYFYDVNKALRRIQGNERLLIEQARATARTEHKKTVRKQVARRYETTRSQESRVLRRNFPLLKTVEFKPIKSKKEASKPVAIKPVEPKPEPKSTGSGNIRVGRLFQALRNSLGRAVGSQVPGVGMPGMGMPTMRPDMPAGETPPGFRPIPATEGNSPFQDVPPPRPDRGESPFEEASYRPKPAVEFANSEGIVHNIPEPETLVVTFPMQPDPPKRLAVDPAPSFNMLDPIPEEEPVESVITAEKAVLAQVEPRSEEKVDPVEKPVEPLAEPALEPETLDPETLAATSLPEVEKPTIEDEPVIEEKPVVENDPPIVPETVAKAEEPKQTVEEPMEEPKEVKEAVGEPKQELAMETKPVEEPVEPLPVMPEASIPLKPESVSETLVQTTPKPATELITKKPLVVEKSTVEKLAMKTSEVEKPVVAPTPVTKTEIKSSEVSKTVLAEKPKKKPGTPKPNKRRIILPSGASVIPSLDLNNLPPEDDPFA